jgi:hypothetical protein
VASSSESCGIEKSTPRYNLPSLPVYRRQHIASAHMSLLAPYLRLFTTVFDLLVSTVGRASPPAWIRGRLHWAVLVILLAFGLPRLLHEFNGVNQYAGNWRMHAAARQAWLAAYTGFGSSHAVFYIQGARVKRVWWELGHCPYKSSDSTRQYRVDIQTYTFFALPLERVGFICGGLYPAGGFGAAGKTVLPLPGR